MEEIQIAADDHHQEEEEEASMSVEDQDSGSDHSDSEQNGGDSESDSSESNQNDEDSESECESETADSDSNSGDDQFRDFTRNGIATRMDESSREYQTIRKIFTGGMGAAAGVTEVVAVHKNLLSKVVTHRAKFVIFDEFCDLVGKKRGGNSNIMAAWYGGSRDEIAHILHHGFSSWNADKFGRIQLVPAKCVLDGVKGLKVGDDGLRHVVLCRVIMGKMEELRGGSEQYRPSSSEFDSGVDCIVNPRRYFVWSSCMHTHIRPSYVVSFKGPASLEGCVKCPTCTTTRAACFRGAVVQGNAARAKRSASFGHVSLAALAAALTRFVTPREMKILVGLFQDFRAKKFGFEELKRKAKLIAGDNLISAMKLAASSAKGSGALAGLPLENGSVPDIDLLALLPELAGYLPASKMEMINKTLGDFKAKRINRVELTRCVRLIVANDNVLVAAIKSYIAKKKQRQQDK